MRITLYVCIRIGVPVRFVFSVQIDLSEKTCYNMEEQTLRCKGENHMHTILVVEDDAVLSRNIALALETEGYRTITAKTVQQAHEMLSQADLILLDVMLPDGSGIAMCREFREISQKPVIFLTSCGDEADIVRGLDCGGDDYITKPFRLRELLSRIKANLRRCAAALPVPELTAVEQKLLEYLMHNREQYLTREQLLEYLWDSKGCFVSDNTLSVNISRLRDKLKGAGCGQIVTKRGMGYKWTERTDS